MSRAPTAADRHPLVRRAPGDLPLACVLIVLLLWGGWFIHRSSFVVDGERYYALFDDAMVSMTYARNLLEGHGLNWAREGGPVEGFTTPLWTAFMVPVNALPMPLRHRSLAVQAAGLLLLLLCAVRVRRLLEGPLGEGDTAGWLPAVVLTAFFYPLAYWTLMGMEVGLQAALMLLAVHFALEIDQGRDRHLLLFTVLAAGYLVRMDMALLAVAVIAWLLLRGGFRRAQRRCWLAGLALLAVAVVGYQVFRSVYFGDLLPNTYYLKLSGIPLETRLVRGLDVLATVVRLHLPALLIVLAVLVPVLPRRRRLLLPCAVVALYVAYSVYVGGDAWEPPDGIRVNRFIAPALPLLFVAWNAALAEWRRRLGAAVEAESEVGSSGGRLVATAATVLLTAVILLSLNGLGPGQEAEDEWATWTVAERPLLVLQHITVVHRVEWLREHLASGARVATLWAGIPSYFTDYRMADILGYNDRHIARLPPDLSWEFRPGHAKQDMGYLLARRPDAIIGLAPPGELDAAPLLRELGYVWWDLAWVREDSKHLLTAPPGSGPAR